jgi:hypothetical protein
MVASRTTQSKQARRRFVVDKGPEASIRHHTTNVLNLIAYDLNHTPEIFGHIFA